VKVLNCQGDLPQFEVMKRTPKNTAQDREIQGRKTTHPN